MYTVALPGYAHTHPMPVLALWRLACTAIGLAIELAAALLVFPVTAREAAHATVAGALRAAAEVADAAFHTVLPSRGGQPKGGAAARSSIELGAQAAAPAAPAEPQAVDSEQALPPPQQPSPQQLPPASSPAAQQPPLQPPQQQPRQPEAPPQAAPHAAVMVAGPAGWQEGEIAQGAVLKRIYAPMMRAYGGLTQFRALLVPLRCVAAARLWGCEEAAG